MIDTRNWSIFLLLLFSCPIPAVCDDYVTVHILNFAEFDESNIEDIHPINKMKPSAKVIKLVGWVKFIAKENHPDKRTYYLEWGRDSGEGRKIIDGYMYNKSAYIYERNMHRLTSYTWKKKRVWPNNKGTYDFTVMVKNNGKFQIIGSASVVLE